MIDGVASNPRGELDLGADRDTREAQCTKAAWCVLHSGHDTVCVGKPRGEYASEDFGPEASKRRRY